MDLPEPAQYDEENRLPEKRGGWDRWSQFATCWISGAFPERFRCDMDEPVPGLFSEEK